MDAGAKAPPVCLSACVDGEGASSAARPHHDALP